MVEFTQIEEIMKVIKILKLVLLLFVFFYTASHLKGSWDDMNWAGGLIMAGLVWGMLFLISLSRKKSTPSNSIPQKGKWALYCPICKNHFLPISASPVCPHCNTHYNPIGENEALNNSEKRKERNKAVTVWVCGCKKNNIQRDMSYKSKCKKCGYTRPDWSSMNG
jgi:hypothetical protein